jgi:membrane protease subunit (stomatin/prohibitin family)
VIFPMLGILAYFLIRGKGMAGRAVKQQQAAQAQFDAYEKSTEGTAGSPTDQIAQAKALLDVGTITQAEFDALKAKALG